MEKMSDFFTARVEGYDEHMLENVNGCREGYEKVAELMPANVADLLDLGCGTGLELDGIFRKNPSIHVTGIDLTPAMLEKLRMKHPDKQLTLINANYFETDFGIARYDAALSFQTMHHFEHADKVRLYTKIHAALRDGGCYIECDYMVEKQADEDLYRLENQRIREEKGIGEGDFYHYDTPCTIENQIDLLHKAGFPNVDMVWRVEGTTIIVAWK